MDSQSLCYSLDLVAGGGPTVTPEQRAALQTSMVILRKNYRFSRVLFWGKVLGLKADYFIAQGKGRDEMHDTKTLYSFNCMDWHLLPPTTDALAGDVSRAARGRFTGDPSHSYQTVETQRRPGGGGGGGGGGGDAAEEEEEEEVTIKVNEESRLAVTVHQIDAEASVVPRGSFIQDPHGLVQANRSFNGLSHSEAGKLHNFLHFTQPKDLKRKSILQMADFHPSMDFLEPLAEDIPKVSLVHSCPSGTFTVKARALAGADGGLNISGSWSLQFEQGSKIIIKSLRWLGLTFYHVPMTAQHGYLYMGDGAKNLDLPFML